MFYIPVEVGTLGDRRKNLRGQTFSGDLFSGLKFGGPRFVGRNPQRLEIFSFFFHKNCIFKHIQP